MQIFFAALMLLFSYFSARYGVEHFNKVFASIILATGIAYAIVLKSTGLDALWSGDIFSLNGHAAIYWGSFLLVSTCFFFGSISFLRRYFRANNHCTYHSISTSWNWSEPRFDDRFCHCVSCNNNIYSTACNKNSSGRHERALFLGFAWLFDISLTFKITDNSFGWVKLWKCNTSDENICCHYFCDATNFCWNWHCDSISLAWEIIWIIRKWK